MRPYLLKIPLPFTDLILPIHAYGFMLAMAFLSAILVTARKAKLLGENEDHVYGLAYWVVISSILGSRIFHCLVYWENYLHEPWRAFFVWEGGLVFYGGLIGALIAPYLYVRRHGLSYWKWADMIAPVIALGLAFGRTGCLLVGCCHGKTCPADFPMALTFPPETVGIAGVPLYPTQVWSIAANLLLAAVLYFIVLDRKRFHGQVMAIFFVLYGVFRSIIELWRDDPRGFATLFHVTGPSGATPQSPGLFGKLLFFEALAETSPGTYAFQVSESQFVSLALFVLAAGIWIVQRKRAPVSRSEDRSTGET